MIINQIVISNKLSEQIKEISREENKPQNQVVSELLEKAISRVPENDIEYMEYLEARIYDVKTLLNRYNLMGNFEVVFEKLLNRVHRKRYDLIKSQDK